MARKTDGEKIDELSATVAVLNERLRNAIAEFARVEAKLDEIAKAVSDLQKDEALRTRDLLELKKWQDEQNKNQDERSRRVWAFGPSIAGAVVSGIIAAAVAFFVARH